jgi:hypothetical protein
MDNLILIVAMIIVFGGIGYSIFDSIKFFDRSIGKNK